MTVVAIITACNVCRIFAGRDGAIVARVTSSNDLRVINPVCWRPDRGVMAVLAHIAG
jgi:hypothetical protein